MEPDFIEQTMKAKGELARRQWIEAQAKVAREQGMQHGRVSYDADHDALIMECWRVRPDDEGDPRFKFSREQVL